jgi:hypothetical protein
MRITKASKLALKNADKFTIQETDHEGYFLVARKGDAIAYIQDKNAPVVFPLLEDAICFLHDHRGVGDYSVTRG